MLAQFQPAQDVSSCKCPYLSNDTQLPVVQEEADEKTTYIPQQDSTQGHQKAVQKIRTNKVKGACQWDTNVLYLVLCLRAIGIQFKAGMCTLTGILKWWCWYCSFFLPFCGYSESHISSQAGLAYFPVKMERGV